MKEIYKELDLFLEYQKCYLELYDKFVGLKKTPHECYNEKLFKTEFTFDRYKKGFIDQKSSYKLISRNNVNIDGDDIKNIKGDLYSEGFIFNTYRFEVFNVRRDICIKAIKDVK